MHPYPWSDLNSPIIKDLMILESIIYWDTWMQVQGNYYVCGNETFRTFKLWFIDNDILVKTKYPDYLNFQEIKPFQEEFHWLLCGTWITQHSYQF